MNNKTPPIGQAEIVSFAGALIQKTSKIYLNLGQEFILTTDDKVRLCLNKHLSRMEKGRAWMTPLAILLTILIVFPTTTFQPFVCSAETWEAVFIISGLICFGWVVSSIRQARVSTSIDDIMADIKRTAIAHETSPAIEVPSVKAKANLLTGDTQRELCVVSATYGAKGQRVDVTDILKSRVTGGKLQLYVSNDNLGGDPIKGVPKALKVTYSHAGETHTVEITEHKTLSLP